MYSDQFYMYCESLFQYQRNATFEVRVGKIVMGGSYPIRLQSMTTTNTLDAEATAAQCIAIHQAGGEIVRITTQGQREARNLKEIKEIIAREGYYFPLVADIHFNPNAAAIAATLVEGVRINPGNFVDGAKKFRHIEFTDETYQAEIEEVKLKLVPFLETCREHGTAVRIGANHGSLSDRVMARYGDTPIGMVESCMEFLRICRDQGFSDIVLSIKSSNTRVMVQSVRLLVSTMKSEGMNFPLHLGVTEAGSGEDGRIKSAVGIGALLVDGIGDTIRVSLTEDPEFEIPVAALLKNHIERLNGHEPIKPVTSFNYSPYAYLKRQSHEVGGFGGLQLPAVVADLRGGWMGKPTLLPEAVITDKFNSPLPAGWEAVQRIVPCKSTDELPVNHQVIPLFDVQTIIETGYQGVRFLEVDYPSLDSRLVQYLSENQDVVLLLKSNHVNTTAEQRAFFLALGHNELTHPVIIHGAYNHDQIETFQIVAGADTGLLFIDGFGDGISLHAPLLPISQVIETSFGILQASRVRFSKTEYISCPGCGRTLFDLQKTTELIRSKTSHLTGLKIAVMGCIVNGIGEMSDADYGYVGSGNGVISLFKNRELVQRNLPQEGAVKALVDLIKESGDWFEPAG